MAKRALDVLLSIIVLILGVPAIAAISALILVMMGFPVLFRQRRLGFDEQPFTLLKFRTMRSAFDAQGCPLPDGVRLTPLGRLLRACSLDELPQFWNVLRGEMSVVGPRPLPTEYLPRYSPMQRHRHRVKPGITGLAQVNGRNSLTWNEKFERDVWYVEHRDFWLDIKIICATVPYVLRRKAISQQGQATVGPFLGAADTATPVRHGP